MDRLSTHGPVWSRDLVLHSPKVLAPDGNTWDESDLAMLLHRIDAMRGRFQRTPVSERDAFRAIALLGWHTGLPLPEVVCLEFRDFSDDGTLAFSLRSFKADRSVVVCAVPADVISAVRALGSTGRLFPAGFKHRWFGSRIQVTATAAGLRGGYNQLRVAWGMRTNGKPPRGATPLGGYVRKGDREPTYDPTQDEIAVRAMAIREQRQRAAAVAGGVA